MPTPDAWHGSHEGTFTRLAAIRQAQINEARETRDRRVANIVALIIREAAKGNALDPEFYVGTIIDNVESTHLTDEQRSWLTLLPDENDEDEEGPLGMTEDDYVGDDSSDPIGLAEDEYDGPMEPGGTSVWSAGGPL